MVQLSPTCAHPAPLPPLPPPPAVGQFLDYCKQYMSDLQARQQLGKVAVPLAEIAAGVLVTADEEEEYYDAARAQSPMSMYSAASGGVAGGVRLAGQLRWRRCRCLQLAACRCNLLGVLCCGAS